MEREGSQGAAASVDVEVVLMDWLKEAEKASYLTVANHSL